MTTYRIAFVSPLFPTSLANGKESVRSELGIQLSDGVCRGRLVHIASDEILHLRDGVLGPHTTKDHGEPARQWLHAAGKLLERIIRRQPRVLGIEMIQVDSAFLIGETLEIGAARLAVANSRRRWPAALSQGS